MKFDGKKQSPQDWNACGLRLFAECFYSAFPVRIMTAAQAAVPASMDAPFG